MCHTVFTLRDPANSISLTRGKEVIIENFDDNTERFFGGILTEVTHQEADLGKLITAKAIDWTFLLDRAVVAETYRGKSDDYIIGEDTASPKGIFVTSDTDFTDFDDSTNVDQGKLNTNFLSFNNVSLRSVMDALSAISGFIWYVDAFKAIHYKAFDSETHAFTMSDVPDDITDFPYFNYKVSFDMTKIVNAVIVMGGFIREEQASIPVADRRFESDGVRTHTSLKYNWTESTGNTLIRVFHNTGTDPSPIFTTEDTVGIAGIDVLGVGGIDVLYDAGARALEWNVAPPDLNLSYQIDGDRLRPLIQKQRDQPSIDLFGREYSITIKDPEILSDEQVILRADAELRRRSQEAERYIWDTTKDGIIAGRTITLTNAKLGPDKKVLVMKVVTRLMGGTTALHTVHAVNQPRAAS